MELLLTLFRIPSRAVPVPGGQEPAAGELNLELVKQYL